MVQGRSEDEECTKEFEARDDVEGFKMSGSSALSSDETFSLILPTE